MRYFHFVQFLFLLSSHVGAVDFSPSQPMLRQNRLTNIGKCTIADIDYDGDMDYIENNHNELVWQEDTNGDGSYYLMHNLGSFSYWLESIEFTDMNNDGYNDIVVTVLVEENLYIFTNDGSGNFTMESPVYIGFDKCETTLYYDFNNDGFKDIYLGNYNMGKYLSRAALTDTFAIVNLNNSVYFQRKDQLQNNYNILADMDNDGDMDIVGVSQYNSPLKWLEFDSSANTFTSSHDIAMFDYQDQYALVDNNNDGLKDILHYDSSQEQLVIYENDVNQSFSNSVVLADSVLDARCIAVADLNNDSIDDFCVKHDFNELDVYFAGTGGYSHAYSLETSGMYFFIADYNYDGYPEINCELDAGCYLVYQNNAGVFNLDNRSLESYKSIRNMKVAEAGGSPFITYSNWAFISEIEVDNNVFLPTAVPETDMNSIHNYDCADIDINGDLDYVVIDDLYSRFSRIEQLCYYQNGQKTVLSSTDYMYGNSSCCFKDMDNDGDLDIVYACSRNDDDHITIYENSQGTFSNGIIVSQEDFNHLELIDVNNDNLPDMLYSVPNGYIRVSYNNGNMSFGLSDLVFDEDGVNMFRCFDMNNDGYLDIIVPPHFQDNSISVYTGTINFGQFSLTPQIIGYLDYYDYGEIIDVDGDGDLDFLYLISSQPMNVIGVLENNGSMTNWSNNILAQCNIITALTAGDIDNNNSIDIVFATSSGEIHEILNNTIITPNVDGSIEPYCTQILGNYPNPFNPQTEIKFSIAEEGRAELSIYNLKGQKVKTLVNDHIEQGEHSIVWNGKDLNNNDVSSGVYFYKLKTEKHSETSKMLLLK